MRKYFVKDEYKKKFWILCFIWMFLFVVLWFVDSFILGTPFLCLAIISFITMQAEVRIDDEGIRHYNKMLAKLWGSQYARWENITLAQVKGGWIELFACKEKGYSKVEIPFRQYPSEMLAEIIAHLPSEAKRIDFPVL